jgi:hypothetical protein
VVLLSYGVEADRRPALDRSRRRAPVHLLGCSPSCARGAARSRVVANFFFVNITVVLLSYGVEADRRPALDRSRRRKHVFSFRCEASQLGIARAARSSSGWWLDLGRSRIVHNFRKEAVPKGCP